MVRFECINKVKKVKTEKLIFSLLTCLVIVTVWTCIDYTYNEDIQLNTSVCISNCLLYLENFTLPQETNSVESLCGYTASRRGNHQKVVSFAFYGEMVNEYRDYYQGISGNFGILRDFYPGWVFRLYIDSAKMEQQTRHSLCSLSCMDNEFDLCPVNLIQQFDELPSIFGMIWRFLPLSDPTVDIMVSRDLDSRFSAREQAAVEEWVKSNLSFHIMRDNPHMGSLIGGGCFGARLDLEGAREGYDEMLREILKNAVGKDWMWGLDQDLLATWVWPEIQKDAMVHDSYTCEYFKSEHWRPWPTKREPGPRNFVGAAVPTDEIVFVCPDECRPVDHKDWHMC